MDEPLQATLADVVSLLHGEQLPYALIGGLASSLLGEPRVTADVDLVVGTDVEGAVDLLGSLENSLFQPLFSGVEEVIRQALILPLLHQTTKVKVDLSIGISGFEQQLIARATLVDVANHSVRLVTPEDLLVMKLLAARPRDLQDVEGIAVVQGDRLDWDYCLRIATELGQAVDVDLALQVEKLKTEYGQAS